MKRWLIIGYFVILVAVIIGLTLTYIGEGYPLWTLIDMPVILGLIAISILLYGLSYKPKCFVWFWKIVPLALVAQYAVYWFLGGRASFDPEAPLSEIVVILFIVYAGLFTAFYLSFKFGYSKTLPAGKSSPKFIAFIFVITSLCVASRYFPLNKERINIKVNYVAEYNKITKPADYDPNENAALYYEKAFEKLVDMPNDVKAVRKVWPADMNEVDFTISKKWIASNSEALGHLNRAAKKPYYWVQRQVENNFFMGILMPDLGDFKTAAYCVGLQARLMASQSRTEPALQQVVDMYRVGTHLTGPRILVEQLVGIAMRTLAVHDAFQIIDRVNVSPDLLQDFQSRLQVLAANQTCVVDFTTEKFMIFDSIQRMFTDDGKGGGHVYGTRASENADHLESLWGWEITPEQKQNFKKLERQQTTELADELYDYFNQAAFKTPWQLHQQRLDLNKVAAEMTKDNPLVKMLTPAFARVFHISSRIRVHTDALITTLALLRYKANKARFPDSLAQLISSGYLKELPMDPYSDGPLVYRRIDDNFTLYSLGADFDDDGGKHSDWGRGQEGGDQVFWPVERD